MRLLRLTINIYWKYLETFKGVLPLNDMNCEDTFINFFVMVTTADSKVELLHSFSYGINHRLYSRTFEI